MKRRDLLKTGAALAMPAVGRAQSQKTIKFVPQAFQDVPYIPTGAGCSPSRSGRT